MARLLCVCLAGAAAAGLLLYAVFLRLLTYQKPLSTALPVYQAPEWQPSETEYSPEGRIDMNTATLEQLISLPGIGEKIAAGILALREEMEYFRYPEDLLRVKGISEAKLLSINDLIYIQPIQERNKTDGNTGSPE